MKRAVDELDDAKLDRDRSNARPYLSNSTSEGNQTVWPREWLRAAFTCPGRPDQSLTHSNFVADCTREAFDSKKLYLIQRLHRLVKLNTYIYTSAELHYFLEVGSYLSHFSAARRRSRQFPCHCSSIKDDLPLYRQKSGEWWLKARIGKSKGMAAEAGIRKLEGRAEVGVGEEADPTRMTNSHAWDRDVSYIRLGIPTAWSLYWSTEAMIWGEDWVLGLVGVNHSRRSPGLVLLGWNV